MTFVSFHSVILTFKILKIKYLIKRTDLTSKQWPEKTEVCLCRSKAGILIAIRLQITYFCAIIIRMGNLRVCNTKTLLL